MPLADLKREALKAAAELDQWQGEWLPMPHRLLQERHRRLLPREWAQYHERRRRHLEKYPDYPQRFRLPKPETIKTVWSLLESSLAAALPPEERSDPPVPADFLRKIHPPYDWPKPKRHPPYDWLKPEREQLLVVAKQALTLILDACLWACFTKRRFTFNLFFETLAAAFSDHFHAGPATSVRDMSLDRIADCRRDLLVNGIRIKPFWEAFTVQWLSSETNPLFEAKIPDPTRPSREIHYRQSAIFYQVAAAFRFDLRRERERRLWPADSPLPRRSMRSETIAGKEYPVVREEVTADRPYNMVGVSQRSLNLLDAQEAVELLFDVDAFRSDFDDLTAAVPRLGEEFEKQYQFKPTLPSQKRPLRIKKGQEKEIWSEREEVAFYRTIAEGLRQSAEASAELSEKARKTFNDDPVLWQGHRQRYLERYRATWPDRRPQTEPPSVEDIVLASERMRTGQWRRTLNLNLTKYDRLAGYLDQWSEIYDQLKETTDILPIRSGWVRLINRRYQPLHFSPTFVSAKPTRPEIDASPRGGDTFLAPYRHRWFKAPNPVTGGACEFVEVDISSSQTQILAQFLGSEKLQGITKTVLAERASKHQPFEERDGYKGPEDERLQELVKVLWMRVLYGSPIYQVVVDQQQDYETYGPGWSFKEAEAFLNAQNEYMELKHFLEFCKTLAARALTDNPCEGLILTDPYDLAPVRWNPIARIEVENSSDGQKLILSLPGRAQKGHMPPIPRSAFLPARANKDGDFLVDPDDLTKMVAPCLVHMLDAFYSSLFMEKLVDHGVKTFVGIHDCWLVPEWVVADERVQKGQKVLVDVLEEAAGDWYRGLGPVFNDLLKYFPEGTDYHTYLTTIRDTWRGRCVEGYIPKFPAKFKPPLAL